jgi:hypothetical protein
MHAALKECAEWQRHQPYIWKPASMKKLEALGLVQPEVLMYCGKVPYCVTDAGRAALQQEPPQ